MPVYLWLPKVNTHFSAVCEQADKPRLLSNSVKPLSRTIPRNPFTPSQILFLHFGGFSCTICKLEVGQCVPPMARLPPPSRSLKTVTAGLHEIRARSGEKLRNPRAESRIQQLTPVFPRLCV